MRTPGVRIGHPLRQKPGNRVSTNAAWYLKPAKIYQFRSVPVPGQEHHLLPNLLFLTMFPHFKNRFFRCQFSRYGFLPARQAAHVLISGYHQKVYSAALSIPGFLLSGRPGSKSTKLTRLPGHPPVPHTRHLCDNAPYALHYCGDLLRGSFVHLQ